MSIKKSRKLRLFQLFCQRQGLTCLKKVLFEYADALHTEQGKNHKCVWHEELSDDQGSEQQK